jgi:threonine/homoserine/homoserine lactone efflux protein
MDLILPILLFAVSASITPGPNNIMLMSSGLNFGIQKSIPHLLGVVIGFPIMIISIGLGFEIVFEKYPFIHQVIKIVGIIYLVYLAWRVATSSRQALDAAKAMPLQFWQAVLFQWVNPKAWVMATGAIAAYTSLSSDFFTQVLIIALTFMVVAFPSAGSWLIFGSSLKRFLQKPAYQHAFNVTMALLLIASIAPVIFELISTAVVPR